MSNLSMCSKWPIHDANDKNMYRHATDIKDTGTLKELYWDKISF